MDTKFKVLVALVSVLFASIVANNSFASIEVREFSSPENRETYQTLTKELRCPKCQNQDIADSNAPIAQDMRAQVHRLVEEGKSHQQVVEFMIERFGEFVTYKPKVSRETLLLWYGPWLLILVGGCVVFLLGRKKRPVQPAKTNDPQGLDSQPDVQRSSDVKDLLKKFSDD